MHCVDLLVGVSPRCLQHKDTKEGEGEEQTSLQQQMIHLPYPEMSSILHTLTPHPKTANSHKFSVPLVKQTQHVR